MKKETSRRDFLRKATVGAAAGVAGVALAGTANAMQCPQKVMQK